MTQIHCQLINKTKEMLRLAINNLQGLTIESLLLGWSFRVVSHSTEASKNFTNTIWTKRQLQDFIRKSISWYSVVVIKLSLVYNSIENENYCRRIHLNKLNFLKELFYEHPKRTACETIFFVSQSNLTRWMDLHSGKLSCSNHQLRQKNTWCRYTKFEVTELCRK